MTRTRRPALGSSRKSSCSREESVRPVAKVRVPDLPSRIAANLIFAHLVHFAYLALGEHHSGKANLAFAAAGLETILRPPRPGLALVLFFCCPLFIMSIYLAAER